MEYVFVIDDGKVKDAYEVHPEAGFMVRKKEWADFAVEEIEERLRTQFKSVEKLREVGNEIVYEAE